MSSVTPIEITPEQLYRAARQLIDSSLKIEQAIHHTGAEIERVAGIAFLGNAAEALLRDYRGQKATMAVWSGTLTTLAKLLHMAAEAFVQADALGEGGGGIDLAKYRPPEQNSDSDDTKIDYSAYGIIFTGGDPTDAQKAIIDAYLLTLSASDKKMLAGKTTAADLVTAIGIINDLKTTYNISIKASVYQPGAWKLSELQAVQTAVQKMAAGLKADFTSYYGADELTKLATKLKVSEDVAVFRLLYPTLTFGRDNSKNVHYDLKDGKVQFEGEGDAQKAKVVTKLVQDKDPKTGALLFETNPDGSVKTGTDGKPVPKMVEKPDGIWYARADGNVLTLSDNVFGGTKNSTLGLTFTAEQLITHEMSHYLTGRSDVLIDKKTLGAYYDTSMKMGEFTIDGTETKVKLDAVNDGYTISPRSSNNATELVTDAVTSNIWGAYTGDDKGTIRRQQGTTLMRTILEAAMKRNDPTWKPPGS